MILTCQQCGKRYLVKDEMIGFKERKVRCVACSYTWVQQPDVSTDLILTKTDDQNLNEELLSDLEDFPSAKQSSSFPLLGWITCLLSVALLLGGVIFARPYMIQMWPAIKPLYQTIGLSEGSKGEGLNIENTVPFYIEENGKTYLIVKGEVVNTSKEVLTIPSILISLRGDCDQVSWISRLWSRLILKNTSDKQCVLQEWRHSFSENRLFSGERVTFETEPYQTVPGATDIVVHF